MHNINLPKNTVVKLSKRIKLEGFSSVGLFFKRLESEKARMLSMVSDEKLMTDDMVQDFKNNLTALNKYNRFAHYAIIRHMCHGIPNGYDCALLDQKGIVLSRHCDIEIMESDTPDIIKTLKLAKCLKNKKRVRFSVNKHYISL